MKNIILLIFVFLHPYISFAQDDTNYPVAMQYYKQGEYDKAAILFKQLFSTQRNEGYFNLYISSLLKSKQFETAEKVTKDLIQQEPAASTYQFALGKIYKEGGQTDQASKVIAKALNTLSKDENKIRELANYLYQSEEYDLAIEVFKRGRKINNDEQLFTFELLSLYRFKKDKILLIDEYMNALKTFPQLLPQAENVFTSVFDRNSDYQLLQNALVRERQKYPLNTSYSKLLIWQYMQQQEYEMALRQMLLEDKKGQQDGAVLFENSKIFMANKAYGTAIKAYDYLLTKGKENAFYLPSKLAIVDARYQQLLFDQTDLTEIKTLATAYQDILQEYGLTTKTLFAQRKLATLQAYYLKDLDKAQLTLEKAITVEGISAVEQGEIKLALGDVYVLNDQPWEAILIYEQVAKANEKDVIGNEAKYRSAKLSFYQGNFDYAKSQADALKASTSLLIANDALDLSLLLSDHLESKEDTAALQLFAQAALFKFKNLYSPAIAKLDSINTKYPANTLGTDIIMAKSAIYIQLKEYEQAATLLNQIANSKEKSLWTDDALFTLAGLYENQLKAPEKAKSLYEKLVTEFPGSMYLSEARRHFRKLRGDNIGS